MRGKVVYVSGKVTGLPYDDCVEKFAKTEKVLELLGFEVINPMKRVPKDTEWTAAMLICLDDVEASDAVLLHEDHLDSVGAAMEVNKARSRQIPVFDSVEALLYHFDRKID